MADEFALQHITRRYQCALFTQLSLSKHRGLNKSWLGLPWYDPNDSLERAIYHGHILAQKSIRYAYGYNYRNGLVQWPVRVWNGDAPLPPGWWNISNPYPIDIRSFAFPKSCRDREMALPDAALLQRPPG